MTTSFMTGFETGVNIEAHSSGRAATAPSTGSPARSGTYGLDVNCSSSQIQQSFNKRNSGGAGASIFRSVRLYLQVVTLPSANAYICTGGTPSGGFNEKLQLNTDGTLSLVTDTTPTPTVRATSSNALTVDGLWHRIEFDCGYSGGTGMRVFVDGVQWASDLSDVNVLAITAGSVGLWRINLTGRVYIDDVVWDDSTLGGALSSDYKIILLDPVSDNARGASWFGGAGGTTNLFDALNNRPPIGTAAASETNLTQIKNAAKDSTGNYDANCEDYLTGGVGASDTVDAVMAIGCQGYEATGTQLTGAIVIVSNPSGQTEFVFDFGDNGAGTVDAFPNPFGWFFTAGPVTASPTVTLGTQPVVRGGRRTATKTNACDFCLLGIYVQYTPAAATPSLVFQSSRPRRALMRS